MLNVRHPSHDAPWYFRDSGQEEVAWKTIELEGTYRVSIDVGYGGLIIGVKVE